jgi:hypothetical protein
MIDGQPVSVQQTGFLVSQAMAGQPGRSAVSWVPPKPKAEVSVLSTKSHSLPIFKVKFMVLLPCLKQREQCTVVWTRPLTRVVNPGQRSAQFSAACHNEHEVK